MKDFLTPQAAFVIKKLNTAGHSAYAVGGAVRDALMGLPGDDIDIATSATPLQVIDIFPHTIDTGSDFGTVTVVQDGTLFEVTTFRCEGSYSDGRHPDSVAFVSTLQEDISRRDFTVNGLAYHPDEGLIDLVGGKADIESKTLRTIGDPNQRFAEDQLRILRGVRFACQLDFHIEESTRQCMWQNKAMIMSVSVERIWKETARWLTCKHPERIGEFVDYLQLIFPEIAEMVGFEQHNPYHHLDVWEHTLLTVAHVLPDIVLRLTMLFHDSGKPHTFLMGKDGRGHFPGHQQESIRIAMKSLNRLKVENKTRRRVETLIKFHDTRIPMTDVQIKSWLAKLGEQDFFDLMLVKQADAAGKNPDRKEKLGQSWKDMSARARELIARGDCYKLRQLAISGDDILALGVREGKRVGELMDGLLQMVIREELPNERQALLDKAKELTGEG